MSFVGTAFVDDTDLIVANKSLLYDENNTSILIFCNQVYTYGKVLSGHQEGLLDRIKATGTL